MVKRIVPFRLINRMEVCAKHREPFPEGLLFEVSVGVRSNITQLGVGFVFYTMYRIYHYGQQIEGSKGSNDVMPRYVDTMAWVDKKDGMSLLLPPLSIGSQMVEVGVEGQQSRFSHRNFLRADGEKYRIAKDTGKKLPTINRRLLFLPGRLVVSVGTPALVK